MADRFTIPEPRLPTWDDVRNVAKGMLTPPDPYQAAGDMINATRQGDYAGALEAGLQMPGTGMFVKPYNPERLSAARGMKAQNPRVSSGDMWDATQTRQGGGGQYMQEIPDNMATVAAHNLPPRGGPTTLGEVLRHNQLYEVEPGLRDLPVQATAPGQGRYDYNRGMLFVDPSNNSATVRSEVLGNVQHAIQHREGWPEGGGADRFQFEPHYGMMPEGHFERRAGQLEGNKLPQATQRRRDMTGAQRAERNPERDMK